MFRTRLVLISLVIAACGASSRPASVAAAPGAKIVDVPGAPLALAQCEVRFGPNNEALASVSFVNRDPAGRSARQAEANVLVAGARGGTLVAFELSHRVALPASTPARPRADGLNPPVAVDVPTRYALAGATTILCFPQRMLFADGTLWLRSSPHGTAPVDPAGCAATFDAANFALAEPECVAASQLAARRGAAVAEVRALLLAARAASHERRARDAGMLLEAIGIVGAAKASRARSAAFFAGASGDQRKVFLLHARDRYDYRGIPCGRDRSAGGGVRRESWTYCDASGRPDKVYSFTNGKLEAVYDPRAAQHVLPA
jgi:hypothetical protein